MSHLFHAIRRPAKTVLVAAACAGLLIGSGCASRSNSGSVYTPGEAQREQTVRMGVVESVRQVTIEKAPSGVGAVAGGVVGGVAGGSVGGGRGSTITSVLGAVAGGLAGQAIEGGVGRKAGLEITVKLDNGELRAITQEADEPFKPGERVRLLSGTGVTRVSH
jgi:outer membrane lipoprotein SlyB